MSYRGESGHKISKGLELAFTQFNNIQTASKFVVLITASESNDPTEKNVLSNFKTRLEASGTKIVVLAVGNDVTLPTMNGIASHGNLYLVDSFNDIIGIVGKLRESICKQAGQ